MTRRSSSALGAIFQAPVTNLSHPNLNLDPSGGGLSTYKPSNLLVEVTPENDIDHRLGVRTLVSVPSKPQAPPIAKSRVSIDHWSSNNGSVIYAQSSQVRTGVKQNSMLQTEAHDRSNIPQTQVESSANLNFFSNREIDVLDSTATATSSESGNTLSGLDKIRISERQGSFCSQTSSNVSSLRDRHEQQANQKPSSVGAYTTHIISHEIKNPINSNTWTNGNSTTSDLLF